MMGMNPDTGVVLAAAGSGSRFGSRKQFGSLADRPILHYSLDVFAAVRDIAEVVVVCPPGEIDVGERLVDAWREEGGRPTIAVIAGGRRRQDSVLRGVEALEGSRYVLVHDAARPLVRPREVEDLLAAIRETGAAVIGTPCFDSVKRVAGGKIVEEIPREQVWTVQTPQGAEIECLREAYARVGGDGDWTDEASLLRAAGVPLSLVEGSRENIKITSPGDEVLAEAILRARAAHPEE